MNALSKMTQARISLVLNQPFFGFLAMQLALTPGTHRKTLWTDGRVLGYNPAFVDGLSLDAVTACVAHEVMHCALGHPWRRGGRDMAGWNKACDKAINPQLVDAGFTLPDGVLYASGDEVGKSAEWIFSRDNHQDAPPQPGQGNGAPQPGAGSPGQQPGQPGAPGQNDADGDPDPLGEVLDAPTGEDENGEPAPSEQEWKERAASALTRAKLAGKVPGGMDREIARILQPRVDVRSLLLRFFTDRAASDYTWTRPSTRYLARGLYMPALDSRELGEVAVMVDTSGSIDRVALDGARAILQSVIDECNPRRVSLYFADAKVCRVVHLERGAPLEWEPKGGGGTDFRPALEQIETDGEPVCAVCITDLYGTFPDAPPPFPVLWLSTTENKRAPFGETVYCDE